MHKKSGFYIPITENQLKIKMLWREEGIYGDERVHKGQWPRTS